MPHRANQHDAATGNVVVLSQEQFDKLVELMTPGYELAKKMLADLEEDSSYTSADVPTSFDE